MFYRAALVAVSILAAYLFVGRALAGEEVCANKTLTKSANLAAIADVEAMGEVSLTAVIIDRMDERYTEVINMVNAERPVPAHWDVGSVMMARFKALNDTGIVFIMYVLFDRNDCELGWFRSQFLHAEGYFVKASLFDHLPGKKIRI